MRLYKIRDIVMDLDKLCYIEPVYTSRGKHLILSFDSGNFKLTFNNLQQADKTFQELINAWNSK